MADGKVIHSKAVGKAKLTLNSTTGKAINILIDKVLYVPEFDTSLFSVDQFHKLNLGEI
jgi:hypothetical protein